MAKRRAHGEGTLYERADGRWSGQYSRPDGTRGTVYGKTQAEARRKLTAALARYDVGLPVPSERITVGRYLEHWLEDSVRPSVRPSTFRSYSAHVERHLRPAIGNVKLARLTPDHVRKMMREQLADGLSAKTIQNVRGTLRAALNQAVRDGHLLRNVAALAEAPKAERPRPAPMSKTQALGVIAAVDEHRLAPLYIFALATGMRQGECLGLRWADVDLEAGTVTVQHALQRIDGELRLVEPKSRSSQRTIAVNGTALAALWRQRAQLAREREYAPEWPDSDLVFISAHGQPLDASYVTHTLQRLLDDAGQPRLRFHDLRHGFATLMLAQGANPRTVQETLGHSQISLTLGTYSHVPREVQREAVERLDDVLGGAV